MSAIPVEVYENDGTQQDKWAISKKLALTIHYLNKRAGGDALKNGGVFGKNYEDNEGLVLVIDKKYALKDSTDFNLKETGCDEKDIEMSGDLIIQAIKSVNVPLPNGL